MRVLVAWGSKRGGTAGIGRILGESLQTHGFDVLAVSIDEVLTLDSFDAVIVGGALYSSRWPRNVPHFVNHHVNELRRLPVWFFSSGPLDASADAGTIPATRQVAAIAEKVGAKGHATFGGRLEPDAKGFPASAMAKTRSGDWRNADQIRAWAAELASELPRATPGRPIERPAHSISRLLTHAAAGWALCAATMVALGNLPSPAIALAVHALAAPLFFTVIAWHYFRERGAREPASTALAWTVIVAVLNLLFIATAALHSLAIFKGFAGTWLPVGLIFVAAWATGAVMSMLPAPKSTGGIAGTH